MFLKYTAPVLAGLLLGLAGSRIALAHDQYSHSLEEDEIDERIEGPGAREAAEHRIVWRDAKGRQDPVVDIKLLGINDFHGQLSPRGVGSRFAGGAAVLAAYLKAAAAGDEANTLIIHAGDHVGASPPNSALLQDEPAISLLNALANDDCRYIGRSLRLNPRIQAYLQPRCNIVGTFGNHEFDEGIDELLRLIGGGNHTNGPYLEDHWRGARFPYVSSNVVWESTGEHVVAPYTIKKIDGVAIGIIGAVLKETPTIVTPSGVAGLSFLDEAESINAAAKELRRQRIKTLIVTIHQGTAQTSYLGPTDTTVQGLSGPIIDIVDQLDDEIDVVISGHRHGFTNALVPNANGKQILLTQAFSASTAYGDIDLAVSRRSGDVVEKSASIVTTWIDEGPGLSPDPELATLVAAADSTVAPLVNRLIGTTSDAITRAEAASGESALGNLIADAQRDASGADFAFMNPGGIRADLDAGDVSWGELFTIQPFNNDLVSMNLTGAQIDLLLEQQWLGQNPAQPRILKTSGLTYTWDASRAIGDRVVEIRDGAGQPLDPAATYRVTVNSFMASGGDNFFVLVDGTERVVGAVDIDALVDYIGTLAQPFTATIEGRITRLN